MIRIDPEGEHVMFGRFCDLWERGWQAEHGTPLDPDDGLLHTSTEARAFAVRAMDIIYELQF